MATFGQQPFPFGDVSLWVSRSPRVHSTGSEVCSAPASSAETGSPSALPCASNSAVSIADLAKVLPLLALLIHAASAH